MSAGTTCPTCGAEFPRHDPAVWSIEHHGPRESVVAGVTTHTAVYDASSSQAGLGTFLRR